MNRNIITICLLLLISSSPLKLLGQDCELYYPVKNHIKLDYFSFDSKQKRTLHHTYNLMAKKSLPDFMELIVEDEITNKKNEMAYHQFRMSCRNGVFYIGTEKYFDPIKLKAYRDMKIDFQTDSLEIPEFSKVGLMLPNASAFASILRGCGPPLMSMKVYIFNRRFDAIESIETPAGTFKCCKLSFDKIEIMGASRTKTHHIEWYAPHIGLVRAEEYNRKGKMLEHTILHCIGDEFVLP